MDHFVVAVVVVVVVVLKQSTVSLITSDSGEVLRYSAF